MEKVKKVLIMMLVLSMVMMPVPQKSGVIQAKEILVNHENLFYGDTFKVDFRITSKWDKHYNATVTVTNTGDKPVEDWALLYYYEDNIENLWKAEQVKNDYEITMIKNAKWNQDIKPGCSIDFGFTASYEDEIHIPRCYCLSTCRKPVEKDDYKVSFVKDSDWGDGYTARMWIENQSDDKIEDWDLSFTFGHGINSIWNATLKEQSGFTYKLRNCQWNQNIEAKGKVMFGFQGAPGNITKEPEPIQLCKYSTEIDPDLDSDGDELANISELVIGTNPYLVDTDEDGLSDSLEYTYLSLDPLSKDTDEDGILDGSEDTDEDGVCNEKELLYGTKPWMDDSDGDGLKDGEELSSYKTNPLNEDTDGDSLLDGDEVTLGLNPLKADTNDNGIADNKEKINQHISETMEDVGIEGVDKVSVDMKVTGEINTNTEIESAYGDDTLSSEVAGLVGTPVEIKTSGEFDTANITFHYDPAKLGGNSEDDLAVMWYDEANDDYVLYDEESVVDKTNHTVSYETTHFSTYMLVNKKVWYQTWENAVDYRTKSTTKKFADIVFTVDASGSMKGSEIKHAKSALNLFIDAKHGKDRGSIVTFTDTAEVVANFTKSSSTLQKKINEITAGGHTDTDKGLEKAMKQFTRKSYQDVGNRKIIVLICDGDVEYNQNIVDKAKKENIKIYSVLVGTDGNADLKKISTATGGKFYLAQKASELTNLIYQVEEDTMGKLNTTDTDHDGLYDVFETKGMLCSNGKMIYTNKELRDTDTDGLSDYEEMGGEKSFKDGKFVKKKVFMRKDTKESIEAYYFTMKTNPKDSDCDNDEYKDGQDPHPLKSDVKSYELKNKNFVPVKITKETAYGGDQNWFDVKASKLDKQILNHGCGAVAVANVLAYWAREHSGYETNLANANNIKKSEIPYKDYMEFIRNIVKIYCPVAGTHGKPNGSTEWDWDSAIEMYGSDNHIDLCGDMNDSCFYSWNKKSALKKIKGMLKKNRPIIMGFYGGSKLDISEYPTIYSVSGDSKIHYDPLEDTLRNHAVTITGIVFDGVTNEQLLQISSWGKKYYVKYQECIDYFMLTKEKDVCALLFTGPYSK